MHSQTTLPPRVQTLINAKGDTVVQIKLVDAKIILTDLYNKQISDSLVKEYMIRDNINASSITLLKTEINDYKLKCANLVLINDNDTKILSNKDVEIGLLNQTIKAQKKEIRKQKILKVVGFSAAVVLPIITLILMSK